MTEPKLTPEYEQQLRDSIIPKYANLIGTQSYERSVLLREIDMLRAQLVRVRAVPVDVKNRMHARNILIARTIVNGISCREAGERFGVTGGHARNVFYRVVSTSFRPQVSIGQPVSSSALNDVRQHADHWHDRIDAVAKYWGVEA